MLNDYFLGGGVESVDIVAALYAISGLWRKQILKWGAFTSRRQKTSELCPHLSIIWAFELHKYFLKLLFITIWSFQWLINICTQLKGLCKVWTEFGLWRRDMEAAQIQMEWCINCYHSSIPGKKCNKIWENRQKHTQNHSLQVKLPYDGVDRDSGSESGHGAWARRDKCMYSGQWKCTLESLISNERMDWRSNQWIDWLTNWHSGILLHVCD